MSKKDKIKELIWKTVYACGGNKVYETKLWKLLFFVETDFYEKYDETITEVKYLKNIHGPTPDYKISRKAIDELVSDGFLSEIKDDYSTKYLINKDYEIKFLSNKQIDSIQNTCKKFSQLTSKQLSVLSHSDPVYLMGEKINSILDFDAVRYRSEDEMCPGDGDIKYDNTPITLNIDQLSNLKNILAI